MNKPWPWQRMHKPARTALISWAVFVVVLFTVVPRLVSALEATRFSHDQAHASYLDGLLQERLKSLETPNALDEHTIRVLLLEDDPNLSFTPTAHNTGFFYLSEEKKIVALSFEDAFDYGITRNLIPDGQLPDQPMTFTSPSELFGQGVFLLSQEGSTLTEQVQAVYDQAIRRDFFDDPSLFQRVGTWLSIQFERFIMQTSLSKPLREHLETFTAYYHPSETLFVSNYRWVTRAQSPESIRHIVFQPGLSTVPEFRLLRFQTDSIQLDTVILPNTVTNIQRGAFPNVFNINRLVVTGPEDLDVEEGALDGVNQLTWIPIIINRDDPQFRLDLVHEGKPLISIPRSAVQDNPTLDLNHARDYFSSQSIEIVSFNIHFNVHNIQASRVYVYTKTGYLGFIVPVIIEDE